VVLPCHATWVQFITTTADTISVDLEEQHLRLALCCLKYTNSHLQLNSGLAADNALHYAVNFWVEHLRNSACDIRDKFEEELISSSDIVDIWPELPKRIRESGHTFVTTQ
jgi:hypothetical protein